MQSLSLSTLLTLSERIANWQLEWLECFRPTFGQGCRLLHSWTEGEALSPFHLLNLAPGNLGRVSLGWRAVCFSHYRHINVCNAQSFPVVHVHFWVLQIIFVSVPRPLCPADMFYMIWKEAEQAREGTQNFPGDGVGVEMQLQEIEIKNFKNRVRWKGEGTCCKPIPSALSLSLPLRWPPCWWGGTSTESGCLQLTLTDKKLVLLKWWTASSLTHGEKHLYHLHADGILGVLCPEHHGVTLCLM